MINILKTLVDQNISPIIHDVWKCLRNKNKALRIHIHISVRCQNTIILFGLQRHEMMEFLKDKCVHTFPGCQLSPPIEYSASLFI